MRILPLTLAPLVVGCSGSPLVDSGLSVRLTSNPGGVAGHPRFALSLIASVHLDELGDAATSGQLEATLDGAPLALDPDATGYFGNGGNFTATFVLPPTSAGTRRPSTATASTVSVTDQQMTWTVQVPDLFANDLQLLGTLVSNQPGTAVWPSAATTDPWSTIEFACIEVDHHDAACHGDAATDPGIDIAHEYVHVDIAAKAGDPYTLWAERWFHPQATSDGPIFFTSILDQVTGTFQ